MLGFAELSRQLPGLLAHSQLLFESRGELPREQIRPFKGHIPCQLGTMPVRETQGRQSQVSAVARSEQRGSRGLFPHELQYGKQQRIEEHPVLSCDVQVVRQHG